MYRYIYIYTYVYTYIYTYIYYLNHETEQHSMLSPAAADPVQEASSVAAVGLLARLAPPGLLARVL